MVVLRILLTSQVLACLLVSVPACRNPVTVRSCIAFTGFTGCVNPNIKEPKLPPRDNTCCGPKCSYAALEPPGACNCNVEGRCLLDTHCQGGVAFYYKQISGCDLRSINKGRLQKGLARLIPFDWTKKTCEAQNTKCGINCCCRETCPTRFCKIQNVTKCQ